MHQGTMLMEKDNETFFERSEITEFLQIFELHQNFFEGTNLKFFDLG